MGIYINPKIMTKEDWLRENCITMSQYAEPFDESKETLSVCLVDNGIFTAAGIAFSKRERDSFLDPSDRRPKLWFKVKTEKLLEVEPSLKFELE